jgi:Raf kinase inhibitor-like YbhB/YbcL family protein
MRITSPAFREGGTIPARYTCRGEDISPPLAWDGVPAAAKSLALICDDPDAPMGTWVHWVVFDIPPETRALREGIPKTGRIEGGAAQGMSDFGAVGYGGPCPPSGTHRYFFKLYALDAKLDLAGTVTKERLLAAMKGRVLAEGQLVGTFGK